ncbi:MAG TPA: GNAT family N-acetyltransferase [Bacteroidales bacterium]|jgi:diamine N-acetyltransferase|nr:GNAT family N-acetyltransferase [Bacteroidales bacterium]HNZ81480.1 GNAT family N-acetyltransferase [Bacteroidales bacterium]HOF93576.1 GNAT family N-acetyltransferase [Bacteroidales bacterium]HOH24600.1 GNAT family N-acetyltransferase [Bacteroidales bacterium]HOQ58608.1 GNAT family N-acetyltransferase [Bacteroidales bacterium]
MRTFLQNEQLRLRSPEPEDLEFLYRCENDTSLWQYGSTLSPFSKYALHQYISQAEQNIFVSRQLRFMIDSKKDDCVVGTIDLYDFDPYHNRAGVGILIDKAYQRRGYATQALKLLIEFAFGFLHIHQLYAYIPTENSDSLALFSKLGFEQSGVLKDWNMGLDKYKDIAVFQLIAP